MLSNVTITLSILATIANAHMIMNNPKPYGVSTLNNSPLNGTGADFPCKQRAGVYDLEGASNTYTTGSANNPLTFIGESVHGGGSCQVSVTYDLTPTKNSVWKVIHSIEGGCPAQNQVGNLGDDIATVPDPYTYTFPMPAEMPVGNATIAWTWFNKVGNREMYMNCGPAQIIGSNGSQGFYESLPDMFVANIGNGCGTTASTDLIFPDPGDSVEQLNGATSAFAAPTGSCQAAVGGSSSDTPAPVQTTISSLAFSVHGGIFVMTNPSPGSEPQVTPTPAITPARTASAPVASSDSDGTAVIEAVESPCSDEGMWNCIDGDSFQRCASGQWSAVIQLTTGTTCTPGQSDNLNIIAKGGKKRFLRFQS